MHHAKDINETVRGKPVEDQVPGLAHPVLLGHQGAGGTKMSKREPTPTFRHGPELTRFVALVDGVGADVGERGLIRGA